MCRSSVNVAVEETMNLSAGLLSTGLHVSMSMKRGKLIVQRSWIL